jgi:hypothetical protein
LTQKLPKKKFFEKSGRDGKHTNSMYVMEAEDFGREFLNDGLKLSPAGGSDGLSESNIKVPRHAMDKPRSNKVYESDNHQNSEEGQESGIEEDQVATGRGDELAGGFNGQGEGEQRLDSGRSAGEDAGAFSSDDEEEKATCVSCVPNTMRALGNCIVRRREFHEEMAEDPEQIKKPSGLFGEKSFKEVCLETQKKSQYGSNQNYGLISVIVKSPDNLTQEQFAS